MNPQTTTDKINLKGFLVRDRNNYILFMKHYSVYIVYGQYNNVTVYFSQVGNGCVGNEVGGCGTVTAIKIHVDFYYWHALVPQVSEEHTLKC